MDTPPRRWLGYSAALLGVFLVLTWIAVAHPRNAVDVRTLHWIAAHRSDALTEVVETLTWLGSTAVLYPVLIVAAVALWRRTHRWQDIAALVVALLGGVLLYTFIKLGVGRARPPLALATQRVDGLAFPSGHATQTTAFWAMLAIVASGAWPAAARWIGLTAVVMVVIVGMTRVYLGAHWVTDVLGGCALGGAWACLVAAGWTASLRRR